MIIKNYNLFDRRRSCISKKEIIKFRSQITRPINSPLCEDLTTFEIIKKGSELMKKDNFKLTRGKIDV